MPDGTYCRRGHLVAGDNLNATGACRACHNAWSYLGYYGPPDPDALRRTADAYAAHYLFDGPHPARTKETA